jgi:hypothetical protein
MVASREAKRAVREFEQSAVGAPTSDLPGVEIVRAGLRDLARRERSIDALLVSMAAPRHRQLGIRVPEGFAHPEDALVDPLENTYGNAAHSRYNALVRRIVSFSRAAAIARRSHAWRRRDGRCWCRFLKQRLGALAWRGVDPRTSV